MRRWNLRPTIHVVKGSAGHLLASAFGFGEPPRYTRPWKRSGIRKIKRVGRVLPLTYCRALSHIRMRDPGKVWTIDEIDWVHAERNRRRRIRQGRK